MYVYTHKSITVDLSNVNQQRCSCHWFISLSVALHINQSKMPVGPGGGGPPWSRALIGRDRSSDPVAAIAGYGANAAALLDYHVDVGLYDLGDLANLKENTDASQMSSNVNTSAALVLISASQLLILLIVIQQILNCKLQFIALDQNNFYGSSKYDKTIVKTFLWFNMHNISIACH